MKKEGLVDSHSIVMGNSKERQISKSVIIGGYSFARFVFNFDHFYIIPELQIHFSKLQIQIIEI